MPPRALLVNSEASAPGVGVRTPKLMPKPFDNLDRLDPMIQKV